MLGQLMAMGSAIRKVFMHSARLMLAELGEGGGGLDP